MNYNLTTDDLSKELFRCVSKEWNTADQEFIKDDSHCPPVHRLPIALPEDHLRGNVLRSPTHLPGKPPQIREQQRLSPICADCLTVRGVSLVFHSDCLTCLSTNSLVSFSMWPSYRLVVMFIRPILDRPKSVSLMWPMDVINKLLGGKAKKIQLQTLQRNTEQAPRLCILTAWQCRSHEKALTRSEAAAGLCSHLSGLRSRCTMP